MGIGKAIALELAEKGAKVALNGRETDKLNDTATELSANGYDIMAFKADIREPEQCDLLIKETIKSLGRLEK